MPSSRSTQGARSKTPSWPSKRVGEIDDVAARLARHLPGVAGEVLIGGEEGEIHVLQMFGKNALNEGRLLAHRFQLAQRLFIVKQADVVRRESCDR